MESTTLNKKDWTLLAIAFAEGKPLSPVQLQKTLFLFGELLPRQALPEDFYEFEPYNYGPFCSAVYRDAEALAEENLAQIGSAPTHGYAQYSVAFGGEIEGESLAALLPQDILAHAREIAEWVRAQSFRGLVSEIYRQYPAYRVNSVFSG